MPKNPIPILLILFLISKRNDFSGLAFHTLELDAFLDNARMLLNLMDRLNNLSQEGVSSSLPDMKKVMELVDKLPI